MNDFNKLCLLAKKCRRVLESELIKNYPKDLAGACGLSSYFLMREAERNNIYVKYVSGYFNGYHHSWIEYDGHIFDLTATQFGILKETYITNKYNHMYRKENQISDIDEAFKFIRTWSFISPKLLEEIVHV